MTGPVSFQQPGYCRIWDGLAGFQTEAMGVSFVSTAYVTPIVLSLMKTRLSLGAALALAALAPVPAADTPKVSAVFVDPDSPAHSEIREVGERAINRLGMTLMNEVTAAVAKSGATKAVDVCHLKALPLTGEIVSGMPRITGVKRTSQKLRNPANAPDDAEKLALAHVEKEIAAGRLPKVLVQRIHQPGGKPEWRVYRPVGVAPQCVTCHGPRESLDPGLAARLAEKYPEDQATGYAAGQWRGLIRVSVAEAPPPAAVPAKSSPPEKTPRKS